MNNDDRIDLDEIERLREAALKGRGSSGYLDYLHNAAPYLLTRTRQTDTFENAIRTADTNADATRRKILKAYNSDYAEGYMAGWLSAISDIRSSIETVSKRDTPVTKRDT